VKQVSRGQHQSSPVLYSYFQAQVFRERNDGKPDNDKKYDIKLEATSVAYLKCDHKDSGKHIHCAVLLGVSFNNPANEVLGKLSLCPIIGRFSMIILAAAEVPFKIEILPPRCNNEDSRSNFILSYYYPEIDRYNLPSMNFTKKSMKPPDAAIQFAGSGGNLSNWAGDEEKSGNLERCLERTGSHKYVKQPFHVYVSW
jgi:hypothetical protein